MRLQEIGFRIRQARIARGLTQASLAAAAGLSRTTLNQLENGLFPDLGVRKIQLLLDRLGLTLSIEPAERARADFVQMACTTANVSFRTTLTEEELIRALLTGQVPSGRRPHLRVLIDESSPALLRGLVREVGRWSKPGRVQKNLQKLAEQVGASKGIDHWLRTT
jgi:transcriptional regulator with XRE-family HTH domain